MNPRRAPHGWPFGGADLDLGGKVVQLRTWGRAHSRGDQVVFLPSERVLFTGDLVENRFYPIFPFVPPYDVDVDGRHWITVVEELARLDPRIVVPGHGEVGNAGLLATAVADRDRRADLSRAMISIDVKQPTPTRRDGQNVAAVQDRLRTAILHGELEPDSSTSLVDLARAFGAGRTPLREALRMLQREGLVIATPNQRVRIASLTAADFEEISIARLLAQLFEITEQFEMETQPQLLLLQKTMVVIEGVGRRLDPEINIWTLARPLIEGWMRDNRGPEASARLGLETLVDLAERVPRLVRSLETLVTDWSRQGVILHAETLAVQAAHRARHLAIVLVPVWITAAALAMIAVTLLFGR